MRVRIKIVQSRGNYTEGEEYDIDEQVGRQLADAGVAKIVKVTAHQTADDLKTDAKGKGKK